MAAPKVCFRALAWLLGLLMAAPPGLFAQPAVSPVVNPDPAPEASALFRQEELDQMLAPIALYPDTLLVQILMAATYPLEVIEASRWVAAHPNLQGPALGEALDRQHWDPSVKSLTNFPAILLMMDQRLDWTQRLGDAFLSQKDQVMDTVQKLRVTARAQGTLADTKEQRVVTEGSDIIIEPADPGVVYVPAYDPVFAYGPWWYPSYPPYSYYPAGAVLSAGMISFGTGVALGTAWGWAWGGLGWRHRTVTVNVYQNATYNRYINRTAPTGRYGAGHAPWRHDPVHRRGIAYRDYHLAQRYGRVPTGIPGQEAGYRGRTPAPFRWSSRAGTGSGANTLRLQADRGRQSRGAVMSPRDATPYATGHRYGTGYPAGTSFHRPSGVSSPPRGANPYSRRPSGRTAVHSGQGNTGYRGGVSHGGGSNRSWSGSRHSGSAGHYGGSGRSGGRGHSGGGGRR